MIKCCTRDLIQNINTLCKCIPSCFHIVSEQGSQAMTFIISFLSAVVLPLNVPYIFV